jgi:exopolyphosphatase / guanosine-5'-triphosphate,3'-diphosphate pyrophosphatase
MRVPKFIAACLFACSTCFGGYKPTSELEQKTHRVAVETVCRAAIDIGSRATKLCVAHVDKETGRTSQILFGEEFPILVGHDLKERNDGTLGDKILLDVENQIRKYRDLALQLGAEKVSGIATAVFRESTNGRAFIDRVSKDLGVDLRVISQQEEGNIGFLTAVAASEKDSNDVIAWDSGGASFQISYLDGEKLSVYNGPWGDSKVLAEMVSTVQEREFTSASSANPATIDDVKELCEIIKQEFPPISSSLQSKIKELDGRVVGIGGGTSIFDMATIALGKNIFDKAEVWSVIESLVGKTDEELSDFPQKTMLLPKLALLYSVMDYFGINSVQSCHAIGSTLGMFMDQNYWISKPQMQVNFYFLRHGETWANRLQIAQGVLNDDRATLTPEGIQVAEQEAKTFSNYLKNNSILIDGIYISPKKRTNQTAQVFLNHFTPGFIDEAAQAFGPQPWGELDGQPLNTIVPGTGYTAVEYAYINRDWKPASSAEFPASESVNETAKRALKGICEVYSELSKNGPMKNRSIVVVTHSDVIKPLLEYITGSLPKGRIPNCRVYQLKMSGIDSLTLSPRMEFIKTIE